MNKDQIKGKMTDIKGRVERQTSEWTGDTEGQAKGAADQVKGKMQKGVGDLKQAGKDAMRNLNKPPREENVEREHELKREKKDRAA